MRTDKFKIGDEVIINVPPHDQYYDHLKKYNGTKHKILSLEPAKEGGMGYLISRTFHPYVVVLFGDEDLLPTTISIEIPDEYFQI